MTEQAQPLALVGCVLPSLVGPAMLAHSPGSQPQSAWSVQQPGSTRPSFEGRAWWPREIPPEVLRLPALPLVGTGELACAEQNLRELGPACQEAVPRSTGSSPKLCSVARWCFPSTSAKLGGLETGVLWEARLMWSDKVSCSLHC